MTTLTQRASRNSTQVNWTLVAAVNSESVLRNNLLRNDEARFAEEIVVVRDAPSASVAYNYGIRHAKVDVVVFAHQDVFLPTGWSKNFRRCIGQLNDIDPNWGVAGVYGLTNTGMGAGFVYSTGLERFVGRPFSRPVPVRTLDELLLILRRSSGLRFDDELPGFHLYGTDICLKAEANGMKNYVIPCFVLHNSNGLKNLPLKFWYSYWWLRRKWKHQLPIFTPCTKITKWCGPIIRSLMRRAFLYTYSSKEPGKRTPDPALFYEERIAPLISHKVSKDGPDI